MTKSKTQECRENWIALGNVIPKCINQGRDKDVAIRHPAASLQVLYLHLKQNVVLALQVDVRGNL
jgi:hypothetical protein